MKTILVLMDSLNRNMLKAYQPDTWVQTPNIDRFARQSIVFDNHWIGSAPCMPARRDLFTGRLNFLERNWGPIEAFDITLQEKLRAKGVFTHMVTDHTHYFETGGENYCQLFDSWDVIRGQEYDAWVSRVKKAEVPVEYYGKVSFQYEQNRSMFQTEADFPSPKTFASACRWLEDNQGADDYFLMVEAFDPHEPFDCTKEYLDLYQDDYQGPRYEWSGYSEVNEPPEATQHLRKQYAGTLTMTDRWFGKLLDTLEKTQMMEDSLVILTTDHGHLLGEHGFTGKNIMHAYNELAHLPLMVHLPGSKRAGERIGALTQNIDFMPTLLDYYQAEIPGSVRGHSLRGILEGTEDKVRDQALFGWHGKAVNVTDGRYTYFRAPASEDNTPCFNYCSMPVTLWNFMGRESHENMEMGRFLKHTRYPVYKIPAGAKGGKNTGLGGTRYIRDTLLFDIEKDYSQSSPLQEAAIEKAMIDRLVFAMKEADSPDEQYVRLGLDLDTEND